MLRDWFSESGAALSITDGFVKRRARNAQTARCNIYPFSFQARHHLLEAFAFHAANQIFTRHREILKMQFTSFDALIAQLIDVATHGKPHRALLDHKCAHSFVRRFHTRLQARQQQKSIAEATIGDPHLGAMD